MDRVMLLEELKAVTEDAVKDLIMPVKIQSENEEQQYRAAEVYLMRLPDGSAAKKKAPYIIHQAITSKDTQPSGELEVGVAVVRSIFAGSHHGLRVEAKADRNGVIYLFHNRVVQLAHVLPKTALIQCADLLQQDDRVFGQPAAQGRQGNMGGKPGLSGLRGDGRRNDRGTVAVAGVILYDKHRPHAPLLAAHHRTQIGIEDVASFYAVVHIHSHSAGK